MDEILKFKEFIQIFRIFVSSVIGILIGLERTKKGKPAGLATYSIICVSSCLLTLLSVYGFGVNVDPSRLIANIITAIGFVAGGVIFTTSRGEKVKVTGITTGATLFCTASLGIAIGIGMYAIAIFVVLIIEINIRLGTLAKRHYKLIDNDEDDGDVDC